MDNNVFRFDFLCVILKTSLLLTVTVPFAYAQTEGPPEVPTLSASPPSAALDLPQTNHNPKGKTAQPSFQQELSFAEGIIFVKIPAGEFLMGSPDSEPFHAQDESPVSRAVIAKPFWISKYEVTQGEWTTIMESNPSKYPTGEDHPVENVSWDDCQRFLQKLNSISPHTFRLPTETEWEYACRAGSNTVYALGNEVPDLERCGWYEGNSGNGHHPVGEKEPNYWGLYDMHGNVYEWCQDYYRENYSNHPGNASAWEQPNENANRVRRGGSFQQPAKNCRAAFRGTGRPENRREDVGLRLVMEE